VARRWFRAALSASQLAEARELVARHALGLGIVSVHEMGGPDVMGTADFDAWLTGVWPLEVVCYWGAADLDFVRERGLRWVGGDLLLDGSLGSRTAALEEDYGDAAGAGSLYESTVDLVAFVTDATRQRIQAAFHCIGDRAVRQAVEVITQAAASVGLPAVRAVGHRLEHCELIPPELIPRMAELGVVASLQPAFDRLWGQAGGLYERRLGHDRAELMNPLRPLADAGVTLAFGSDANVSPMGPWASIEAAMTHHRPEYRLDADRALRACIIGGRRAARQRGVGVLAPGQRADLAAFELDHARPSRCVLTVIRGRVAHGHARSRS
jgi:predicted amidohydrolase YtcJ